jgi:hypothetical protein
LILALAACNGDGGGGGGGGATKFTSFSAVVAGEDTEMEAETRVANYTANQAGQVTSVGASEMKDGTFTFALDNLGDFTKARLSIPPPPGPGLGSETNISFDTADGDTIILGALVDPVATGYYVALEGAAGLLAPPPDEFAVISDHNLMGFEYQSYGVWLNGLDAGMGVAAAMTAGAATPALGIPVGGVAVYDGSSTGLYVDPAGDTFLAFADFGASVDFGTLAISVSSTDTQVLDLNSGVSSANFALNYAGAGAVAPDGSFVTAIAATDLVGTLDGKLYGPSAQELGGTFAMSGLNGRYIGAVGAAQ